MHLPPPFPDELVGSYLVRMERVTGMRRERLLFRLTGHHLHAHSVVLTQYPSIAAACGMSFGELLSRHTVLPYFTAFMAVADRRKFWATFTEVGQPRPNLAVIVRHTTEGLMRLQVCSRCITEDVRRYGISYWHRAHHVSGVRMCSRHATWLISTTIPLQRRLPQLLPHEVGLLEPTPVFRSGCDAQFQVARLSYLALRGRLAEGDWPGFYRDRALELGFRYTKVGALGTLLSQDLERYFGQAYLEQCGQALNHDAKVNWPGRLLQPRSMRASAFRHVLLNAFFASSPSPSSDPAHLTSRQRPAKRKNWALVQSEAIEILNKAASHNLRVGTRVSAAELYELASIASVMKTYRTRVPDLAAWFESFADSSIAKKARTRRPRRVTTDKKFSTE